MSKQHSVAASKEVKENVMQVGHAALFFFGELGIGVVAPLPVRDLKAPCHEVMRFVSFPSSILFARCFVLNMMPLPL
jgi:hypothetical protein